MQKAILILLIALLVAPGAGAATDRPDTLVHVVKAGDSLVTICGVYRGRTGHYSLTDMLTDVRRANGTDADLLRIGQRVRIPVRAVDPGVQVQDKVRDGAEVRGIYLTAPACAVSSVFTRVDRFIAAGGNAVVFDAKDIDGGVSFRSSHALASWGADRSAPLLPSLRDMMARFDRRDLYVVARIALFLDGELGTRHPELALQTPSGEPWPERGCVWVDPANPAVREYNLTLARELAAAGVDEIQFDYVRFPTNGWRGDWTGDLEGTALRRREIIAGFLAEARAVLAPLGVRISADLYGIMAWDRVEDLALTGQHVPTIAEHVDVICPMIYPSHFGPGFEGRQRPGDDPGYFISEGTRRFLALAGHLVEIRPWLQAFPYRVSRFDGEYVRVQMEAARQAGGAGWCLWNPSCRYGVALDALAELNRPAAMEPVVALVPAAPATAKPVAPAAAAVPVGTPLFTLGALVADAPQESRTP